MRGNLGKHPIYGQIPILLVSQCHKILVELWLCGCPVAPARNQWSDITLLNSFSGSSIYEELNRHVTALAEKRELTNVALLAQNTHVIPDFHGNRSPIADPSMTGMVSNLRGVFCHQQ